MHLRKHLLLLCLGMVLACGPLAAQIILNGKGEITEIGKRQPRAGKRYPITVKANHMLDTAALRGVTDAIRTADTLMTDKGQLQKEKDLIARFTNLHRFFRTVAIPCMPNYTDTLKYRYGILTAESEITKLLNDPAIKQELPSDTCAGNCRCATGRNKLLELVQVKKELTDFEYKRKFARDLFCEVNGAAPKAAIFDIDLRPGFIHFKNNYGFLPGDLDFFYRFQANKVPIPFDRMKRGAYLYQGAFTPGRQFSLTLQSVDPVKALLVNWHNKTAGLLNSRDIKNIRQQLEQDTGLIRHAAQVLQAVRTDTVNTLDHRIARVDNIAATIAHYDTLICPTSGIGQYLRHWFWIGSISYKLNYTGFADTSTINSTIKAYDANLKKEKIVAERVGKIEAFVNCMTCQQHKSVDTLMALQDTLVAARATLAAIQEENKSLKSKIDKYQQAVREFTTTTQLLHHVRLPLLRNHQKQSVIHHDATDGLEIMDARRKNIFPDDHDIYLGVVNGGKAEGEFTITPKQETFDDTAVFTRELGNAVRPLAEAAAKLAPLAVTLDPFLSSVVGAFGATSGSLESRNFVPDPAKAATFADKVEELSYQLWKIALLRTLVSDYGNSPTPPKQTATQSADTSYFTYTRKAEKWAAPYTNNYTFSKNDKPIVNHRYSVGRQRTLSLGAGIFFNDRPARQQTVEATGDDFSVKNTDNKAKFVIGLKVYPFKSLDAEGGLIPRYPLKRLHLFGGFEITKPLDNQYLGLGYDIVPGLQISCGAHIYRKDYYKMLNNEVQDKTTGYEVSGAYYGVTIDPIVLADIIKTIFK